MCDLLGMSYSIPVKASISLDLFQLRGEVNPDGWGIAYYHGSSAQLVKESSPAPESRLYDFVEKYPASKIFLSHVRRSTMGNRSYMNTHPFYRVFSRGNQRHEYCFAHNGTISNFQELRLTDYVPIGETDSEHVFCYLLSQLGEKGPIDWEAIDYKFLEELLQAINTEASTMNCMLTDGERLICYSDEGDHNGGLRYRRQEYPFGRVDLVEESGQLGTVDVKSSTASGEGSILGVGYVISTRLLTSGHWTELTPGSLMVSRNGNIEYPPM
jgi:predicted glutamine amidotransferase